MRKPFTVALIGPDGAGKTTVAERLADRLPFPSTYLYMGVSAASSNRVLPTTALVRAVRARRGRIERGPRIPDTTESMSLKKQARAMVRLANRMAEETYRQTHIWRALRRDQVVIMDRHFFADYFTTDVRPNGGRPKQLDRRIHGFFLRRVLPRPDLVVYLDAPAEVLFARKGEGTIEVLEALRQGYEALGTEVAAFERVDATADLDTVTDEVVDRIVLYSRST